MTTFCSNIFMLVIRVLAEMQGIYDCIPHQSPDSSDGHRFDFHDLALIRPCSLRIVLHGRFRSTDLLLKVI